MVAGPGRNRIRPSPTSPSATAGTASHGCGCALDRVVTTAIRPQPIPNASINEPVTTGSDLPAAGPRTNAIASASPTASEARIARTGERSLRTGG